MPVSFCFRKRTAVSLSVVVLTQDQFDWVSIAQRADGAGCTDQC